MEDDEEIFRKVTKWAKMLEKDQKIEHALYRLESVHINLNLLSVTGVGKAVNALRKHPEWGDKATALVSRWKDIARSETAAVEAQKHDGQQLNKSKRDSMKKDYINDQHRMDTHGNDGDDDNEDDDEPVDAFTAQLAAADHIDILKNKSKIRSTGVTIESIQNSLLDSITNPPVLNHIALDRKERIDPADINMFKAPKEKRRIYAGRKKERMETQEVPKLYDLCIRFLISNIDAIEETGNIPFHVLQPVLERANAMQLKRLEEKNLYLQEDTDYLWMQHCEREFPKELNEMLYNQISDDDDEDMESDNNERTFHSDDGLSWRERYAKFLHERERKLRQLSKKIKLKTNELMEPQRKAVVTAPIAPRNVRKRQIQNGMMVSAELVPSVIELTRARRQIFQTGNDSDFRSMPRAIRNTSSTLGARSNSGNNYSSSSSTSAKKKQQQQRGPLMLKTLKMLKKQKR